MANVGSTVTAAPPSTPAAFEAVYAGAGDDPTRIPWHTGRPSRPLVAWLNAIAPSLIRCGSRVAVVGCGLGEDAREIIRRGYDVTAFDVSATAVNWAKRLDPLHETCYCRADLFDPPSRWCGRFDLVVEAHTLQALPPHQHGEALRCIARLAAPHGRVLVIARATDESVALEGGPPWPLTLEHLANTAAAAGLTFDGEPNVFQDEEDGSALRLRALLHRA